MSMQFTNLINDQLHPIVRKLDFPSFLNCRLVNKTLNNVTNAVAEEILIQIKKTVSPESPYYFHDLYQFITQEGLLPGEKLIRVTTDFFPQLDRPCFIANLNQAMQINRQRLIDESLVIFWQEVVNTIERVLREPDAEEAIQNAEDPDEIEEAIQELAEPNEIDDILAAEEPDDAEDFLNFEQLRAMNDPIQIRNWLRDEQNQEILREITSLDFLFQDLVFLPVEIELFTNLQTLNLDFNALEFLPREIGNLKNLTSLSVSGNKLRMLPRELENLESLRELSVSNNELSLLPRLDHFKQLEILDLAHNHLKFLPSEIGSTGQLRILSITHNEIEVLPSTIGNLKRLEELNVSFNKLEFGALPSEINEMENLLKLDLSNNEIQYLPEIGNLVRLETLNLSENQLTELPSTITQLVNLNEFRIQGNQLEGLPSRFGDLQSLRILDLSHNQLKSLPFMDYVILLEELDLSNNQLTSLEAVRYLNPARANFSNNPIVYFPSELQGIPILYNTRIVNGEAYWEG